jgi:hypothetical protein
MRPLSISVRYSSGICRVFGSTGALYAEVYNPQMIQAIFTWVYGNEPTPENVVKIDEFRRRGNQNGPNDPRGAS